MIKYPKTDKISKHCLSVATNPTTSSPYLSPPPTIPASFSSFTPASESEIFKILSNCTNKQADSHPISTLFLEEWTSVIVPIMTNIVNLPLSSGQFHHTLKESIISPRLKKFMLDRAQLLNHRSVSNLSRLSKIIEHVVKSRLTDHLTVFLILTSLPTVNTIPLKLLSYSYVSTIITSMHQVHNKYHVSASSTSLLPLTPSTMTF